MSSSPPGPLRSLPLRSSPVNPVSVDLSARAREAAPSASSFTEQRLSRWRPVDEGSREWRSSAREAPPPTSLCPNRIERSVVMDLRLAARLL